MTLAWAADHNATSTSLAGLVGYLESDNSGYLKRRDRIDHIWGRSPQSGSCLGNDRPASFTSVTESETIESKLSAAKQRAKVETSKIAARISPEWKKNLFWQLDALLDPAEWDATDDAVLSLPSWQCFLKGLFVLRAGRLPGLGLSERGNLVASWSNGSEHLDIEFKPEDQVRCILAATVDDGLERVTWRGPVVRLPEVLAPYAPERWFAS
jgi:hypothetical protein